MVTLAYITDHFREAGLLARPAVFAEYPTQVESWFKGELILLFSRALQQGMITHFEIEPHVQAIRPDFALEDDNEQVVMELKCGHQSYGQDHLLPRWFHQGQVHEDFLRLDEIHDVARWVLVFMYPKPQEIYWQQVIHFHEGWHCETNYADYPNQLLIGSWRR
jgi:hypothetical protein